MLTWIRRLLLIGTFLSLLVTNILTLTSTAFNAALSGLLGTALGVRTVAEVVDNRLAAKNRQLARLQADTARRKAATRRFGTRLASRTKRVAAKSIASIPAESIPLIGIAVLIADTSYELYAACETMNDLETLYSSLGMREEISGDTLHSVCNPDLPDAGEVWEDVLARSSDWIEHMGESM